jgi:hypothetical protein
VLTLADAITIATTNGFSAFEVKGTVTLTAALTDWSVRGVNAEDTVNLNGQSVNGSLFESVTLNGAGGGTDVITARHCELMALSGVRGEFTDCHFEDNMTLIAGSYTFDSCISNIAGVSKPYIDFNGVNADVSIRAYSGGLEIRNMTHASSVMTVDCVSGAPLVAATCTSGTIVFRGVGNLTDSSAGTTVVSTGWVDGTDILLTRKLLQNRVVTDPTTGTITVYDDDNSVLLTANIYEDAAGTTPYSATSTGIDRKDRAE